MNTKTTFFGGLLTGCVVGLMAGSYLEYTRVTATKTRQLLKENQATRDAFNMTDAELIETAKKIPQFMKDEKRQEEMAASFALRAFRDLAKGNIEDTKADLLRPIDLYYSLYHEKGGDQDTLAAIEAASKEFPELAARIAKKK